MRFSVCIAAILLFLGTIGAVAQDESVTACPMRMSSFRWSPVVGSKVTYGDAPVQRKISFRYENVSGKDVESISLRIHGRLPVSGPTGPSMMRTSKPVILQELIRAGRSGKMSVKVTTLPDVPVRIELTEVKFADGSVWANSDGSDCSSSIR